MARACLAFLGLLCLGQPTEVLASAQPPKVADLTARLDARMAQRWAAQGVKPAPLADDAEFIRRLYLDLVGHIPSITDARDFLDDTRPDKRRIWTERLLQDKGYAVHFANVWRALLLSQGNQEQAQAQTPAFERWWRERLEKGVGYDAIVRELITGPANGSNPGPAAFYQVSEFKPENLAGSTSRFFLGVRLECAQCHKHPFAQWTRQQFWEYAAFFAGANPQTGLQPGRHAITIPGTNETVEARFLDGGRPPWKPGDDARTMLADWMTRPNNPFFARAAVNHVWRSFFGLALEEPTLETADDAGNRELLDELAQGFVAAGYDLKFLIRVLTGSRAYQLTSTATDPSQDQMLFFARMPVRGLTPEQLFDSLAEATEYHDPFASGESPYEPGSPSTTPRGEFLAKFPPQENRLESETSIQQALFLMNGKFMADATSLERSKTLTTIAESAHTTTARRVETLYLLTLCRKPRPEEMDRLARYVDAGGPAKDSKKALADVFWALLNSGEFLHNH
jgi:hypothetical protein